MHFPLSKAAALPILAAVFAVRAGTGLPTDADLERCAPAVDPETMSLIVRDLSGGNPYAVTPFGGETLPYANPSDAAAVLADERNVPEGGWLIGIAQVNSAVLAERGMKPAEALDPCVGLRVASEELKTCFESKSVSGAREKLRPLLACFYASRVPEKDLAARIRTVIERVNPAVPSLSSLMTPAPEEPLVYSAAGKKNPLIF